jgi:hypothetical protein
LDPAEALQAWKALVSQVGFDHLPNTTNRFLPRIYLRLRGIDGVPEFARIRGTYKLNWAKNSRLLGQTSPLFEALSAQGIHFFVIKGLAVALHTDSLGSRVFGDIDFVVEPSDILLTTRIMAHYGWRLRVPNSPLGLSGLGGYVNESGLLVDLHSSEQFPPHLQMSQEDLTHMAWSEVNIPIPSRQLLSRFAIHHGTRRAAESDLVQAIVDFVDLQDDSDSTIAEEALLAMRQSLASTDFLPLLAEVRAVPKDVFQKVISPRKIWGGREAAKLSLVSLRKVLLAPALIWRRRLERDHLVRLVRATRFHPRMFLYATWIACGQFLPIERHLLRHGLRIARPAHLFAKGGPVPERDFRLVVASPVPGCQMVSITLSAKKDTRFSGERERSLAINGTSFGLFPVDGNLVARYLLESPGRFLEISLSSSHRLAVQQFARVDIEVREVAF